MQIRQQGKKEEKIFAVLFFAGFCLGVLYGALSGEAGEIGATVINEYYFSRYAGAEISEPALFWYVFRERLSVVFFLWMLGMTVVGGAATLFCTGWFGFSVGMILASAVKHLGIRGILFCVGAVLPHYFLYIPLMFLFLRRVHAMSVGRELSLGMKSGIWKSKKQVLLNYAAMLLFTIFGIFLSCLLESYLNPQIVRLIVKKM